MRDVSAWITGLAALALFGAGAGSLAPETGVEAVAATMTGARAPIAPPRRIVSLNLCVDQVLLDLVPRERIAGLSFLATDPSMSVLHREARGIPAVSGSAEEVLNLDPDVIFAGEWTTPATVDLLRRLGRNVVIVPMASNMAGIEEMVKVIAMASGEAERGAAMIAEFKERLAAIRVETERPGPRPTAVAMQVNSIASGPGSLVDDILTTAGFDNLAGRVARGPTGRVSLETLVATPPDVIVLANAASNYRTILADNLRHPAFRDLATTRPAVHIPMAEWLCGTPRIIDAVARLASARQRLAATGTLGRDAGSFK
ncbi:MAG: ABC transporter substrate-binding protein [Hyphomicrobium sp.]|nr:ABC transporter substrate-binding protein [Hyphomicrobium sp.]